jgi:methyl-accepting chemotaxis protein-1 (serine sensor receptor)
MLETIEKFVQPGMRIMRQLPLSLKFAVITGGFMLPLGIALYAVNGYAKGNIEFAANELRGTEYLKLFNSLLNHSTVNSHDLMAAEQLRMQDDDSLKIGVALDSLTKHSDLQLADAWIDLYTDIGDNSQLILDPDLDSYYTMAVVVDYGPKLMAASKALGMKLGSGSSDPANVADIRYLETRVKDLQSRIQQAIQRAGKANTTLVAQLNSSEWQASTNKLLTHIDAVLSGNNSGAAQANSLSADASLETLQLVNKNLDVLSELLQRRIDGLAARRNSIVLLALSCLVVCCYLVTSFYFSDRRGFAALKSRMDKLASGDLTVNYPARGGDEIGLLINAFNDSRAQLQVLVERIHHAADTISTAGREISSANTDLADRSSAQAEVIDETAHRIKQVTDKVQANLQAASNANAIAREAHSAAGNGKVVVDSVVVTMDAMTGSSKRIGAIIDVINEIAFQTNLLALNAAVEAARAGEQGRGFAVVAGEVRNLAQRCATAASEITLLIKASVDDVDKGVGQVAKAGAAMNEILASVKSVSAIMSDMTEASKAQINAITGIDDAVSKINADAQQNAAIVEQTAAAADLLREQASVLVESVGHFTLGSEQNTRPLSHEIPTISHDAPAPLRHVA